MSIQCPVLGFEPIAFITWVSSLNHSARAPALNNRILAIPPLSIFNFAFCYLKLPRVKCWPYIWNLDEKAELFDR